MNVKISLQNSKLGGSIPTVSIWRFGSCRPDAPCFKTCYAGKYHFVYPTVVKSYKNNLAIYISNPDFFFNDIIYQLKGLVEYKYFRWHVAGDIVDDEYFKGVVKVALNVPQTKFLIFTKKYDIVNNYVKNGGIIPNNLKVVFSHWDKEWEKNVDNPYNFSSTYVYFEDTSLNANIPTDAMECSGFCENCLGCWSLKDGSSAYFHKH